MRIFTFKMLLHGYKLLRLTNLILADGAKAEINTEQTQSDIYKDLVELTQATSEESADT